MLNSISIMGRLVRDPELRHTQTGKAVANITIACERDFDRDSADFIDVVFWDKAAEFVSKYFHKGSMAVVDGRVQMRKYESKDGSSKVAYEVVGEHIYFGDSKRDD